MVPFVRTSAPDLLRAAVAALVVFLTALSLAAGTAAAQDADLPPLIERDRFFGDPEYAGAQISPDGSSVAFRSEYRGTMNVWVKGVDEPFDDARPVTADTTRPIGNYFWSRDSERILYTQDQGGDENFRIYAVDPRGEPEADTGVPPARDLTPYEDVRAVIYAVPKATPDRIVVGLNDRDPQYHDVYRLNLETGERTLLVRNDAGVAGWQTDLEGRVRLAVRQDDAGDTEIHRVEGDTLGEVVYRCTVFETCGPIRFHRDGRRVYMRTDRGDDVDLQRLVLFEPETGEVELVESDPEGEVDFGGARFSSATDELVATYYVGDRLRYYPKDERFAEDLETIRTEVPDGEVFFGASTLDETKHIVSVRRDVDPGSTYLYDREEGTVERLYRSRPDLPSEHLAPMRALRYEARDGLEIAAYLTVPRGVAAEELPVVVHPHGGPWARDTWGYHPYVQFLANRGYAVLQPNFRGSTGYGQEFLNAGNEEWGSAMQDDITDGVRHLIEEGIADPERVGIFGGSYGGYATLAGLTFTPDLYAAGVSFVGPSNLLTLLESIPPYWAPQRRMFDVRVGDPDDPDDRERLRRQSPLFSAERIRAPLMVIQGANDPRVKKRESDQIVVAARENSVPVEYLVAENEGHGFANEDNRLAMTAATEEFLARHLGGRYQEETTEEIAATLDDLRVDPATVEMPDEAEVAAAEEAATAPLPEADGSVLEPARLEYAMTIEAQGRTIDVDVTRTIEAASVDGEEVWRIVDENDSPMGGGVDTFTLDRETLRPLERSVSGQTDVTLTYRDDAVTGEAQAMGRTVEIDESLDAPVLGDGAALEAMLAGLPLGQGYETTVRVFDAQRLEVQAMRITVAGTEIVEVPAGTFDTWVVELEPLGDAPGGAATFHVHREAPHHVVRSEARLPPQMGGGTTMRELVAHTLR